MNIAKFINQSIDYIPFLIYALLIGKIMMSWMAMKSIDPNSRSKLAAPLLLVVVVALVFMVANLYALAVFGKTLISIRVYQMFVVGNCVALWVLINIIVNMAKKDSAPTGQAEGTPSEPTD